MQGWKGRGPIALHVRFQARRRRHPHALGGSRRKSPERRPRARASARSFQASRLPNAWAQVACGHPTAHALRLVRRSEELTARAGEFKDLLPAIAQEWVPTRGARVLKVYCAGERGVAWAWGDGHRWAEHWDDGGVGGTSAAAAEPDDDPDAEPAAEDLDALATAVMATLRDELRLTLFGCDMVQHAATGATSAGMGVGPLHVWVCVVGEGGVAGWGLCNRDLAWAMGTLCMHRPADWAAALACGGGNPPPHLSLAVPVPKPQTFLPARCARC